MARQVYSAKKQGMCSASATDEKGADGASHHYEFTHHPTVDSPAIPLSSLKFQNGDPAQVGVNGVTDEMVLAALIDHLKGFQGGPYACNENANAVQALINGLAWLNGRPNLYGRGIQGAEKP